MKKLWNILLFSLIGLISLSAQQLNHVPGEVLVRLPNGIEANIFAEIVEEFNGKQTQFEIKSHPSHKANIWLYSFDNQTINEYSFLDFLKNHPLVVTAQFNHWTERRSLPNDAFYGLQWHWDNTGQSNGLNGIDVDAEAAWDITTGGLTAQGDTIVLAIIDDGMELDHPDLQQNLWVNHAEIPFNGIDDDQNGFVDDYRGWNVFSEADNQGIGSHGTAVAGIAGAVGNNEIGVAGLNWDVKIMSILASGGTEAEIIQGYDYACIQRDIYNQTNGEQGAFVVATNTSFGIDAGNPEDSPLWCDFFDILGEFGILSVAATSNDNVNIDVVGDLPTTCSSPYLISVTATDHNDNRNFSAYGIEHIDIAAPGEAVWTLAQGEGVGLRTGTSFAAPAVTGLVGLLYSLPCAYLGTIAINEPTSAAELVRDFIYSGVENIPDLANEVGTGGRMNAYLSLTTALNLCENCTSAVIADEIHLSPSEISIAFVDFDSDSTDIFWKRTYDDNWSQLENINSPVLLANLDDCETYEYYLVSNCGENQITSTIHETQTIGCCLPPTEVNWALTDITTALISWTADEYNAGYFYRYRINESEEWEYNFDTISSPFSFSNMLPCTLTEMQITPICPDLDTMSFYGDSFLIMSGGCGTCTDADYCAVQGFSSVAEYIDGVLIGSYASFSGNNDGYGDFTGENIELMAGEENFFSLSPGFPLIEYEEAWRIWIDLDHSGTFENEEIVFQTDEAQEGIVTGTFIIPEGTGGGSTRMRIAMSYAGDGEPLPAPCLSFPYGEVEDYCVYINELSGGSSSCSFPTELNIIDSTENSIRLEWSAIENAEAYEIFYQAADLSFSDVINVTENEFEFTELADCKSYSLHIKTVCENGWGNSIYSPAFEFAPICISAISEEENPNLTYSVFPNPTTGSFTLFISDETVQDAEISIFAADGKMISIQNYNFSANQNSLVISKLDKESAGIYFLKIQSAKGIEVVKIVKQE